MVCRNGCLESSFPTQRFGKGVVLTPQLVGLYRYVKSLVDKCNEKIENWRNVTEWLEESGYRTQWAAKLPISGSLAENSVVNITNITFENNQIKIGVYLQLTVPLPSELPIQDLDLDDNTTN